LALVIDVISHRLIGRRVARSMQRPSTGSIGSATAGCRHRSATSRRRNLNCGIIANETSWPPLP